MQDLEWNESYSFDFPKNFADNTANIYTVVRNIHKSFLEGEAIYKYEVAIINTKNDWLDYVKQKELEQLQQITYDIISGEPKRDTMGYSALGYMLADKIENGEIYLGSCPDNIKEEVEKILNEYKNGLMPNNQNEGKAKNV